MNGIMSSVQKASHIHELSQWKGAKSWIRSHQRARSMAVDRTHTLRRYSLPTRTLTPTSPTNAQRAQTAASIQFFPPESRVVSPRPRFLSECTSFQPRSRRRGMRSRRYSHHGIIAGVDKLSGCSPKKFTLMWMSGRNWEGASLARMGEFGMPIGRSVA